MTGDEVSARVELNDIFNDIGPNARDILMAQARGLRAGKSYGDFDDDRDQPAEAFEEARDGDTYLTDECRRLRKAIAQLAGPNAKELIALTNRLSLVLEARSDFRSAKRRLLQVKKSAEQPEQGGGE